MSNNLKNKKMPAEPDGVEKDNDTVYVYCCVHSGIRIKLKNGFIHLKSANEIRYENDFYNINLNPNKYSITPITKAVMEEIKETYKNAAWLKKRFVFFAYTKTLDNEQLEQVLIERGDSPWKQLSKADINKIGVQDKTAKDSK